MWHNYLPVLWKEISFCQLNPRDFCCITTPKVQHLNLATLVLMIIIFDCFQPEYWHSQLQSQLEPFCHFQQFIKHLLQFVDYSGTPLKRIPVGPLLSVQNMKASVTQGLPVYFGRRGTAYSDDEAMYSDLSVALRWQSEESS